jgi:hypothetical protein
MRQYCYKRLSALSLPSIHTSECVVEWVGKTTDGKSWPLFKLHTVHVHHCIKEACH